MKTFAQLKAEIRHQVWPSGEPENLAVSSFPGVLSAHDQHFQEAMGEIAKWVECEQVNNLNAIPFCNTHFKCGMTVVPAPDGIVKRVLTVASSDFCSPIIYRQVDWPGPECFGRRIMGLISAPFTTGPAKLPWGFSKADAGRDARCGRARTGIWAIYRGNIYIAPWIQSSEQVLLEWDGLKKTWADSDPVNESQDFRKALSLYWQYAHERDFGESARADRLHLRTPDGRYMGLFDEALADLAWWCREKTRRRNAGEPCAEYPDVMDLSVIQPGLPDDGTTAFTLAQIGNFGSGGANAGLVAALLKKWNPSGIITSGNNCVGGDYDLCVGQFYSDYIAAYGGGFGRGSDINAFWPAPGAQDWLNSSLGGYQDFFELPNNERYYDICLAGVHLLVLDDSDNETDGNSDTSVQALWLKAKLALSTGGWKVVVLNRSPYASQGGVAGLRWPFKDWGADLVISGDLAQYERLSVSGLPFILNGLGGIGPILAISGPADSNSVLRYDGQYGAGKITATLCSLRYEFIGLDGTIVDTLELTKADCPAAATGAGSATFGGPGTIMPFLTGQPKPPVAVHEYAGNPNGHVRSTSPGVCFDSLNNVVWTKNDGVTSDTGWE